MTRALDEGVRLADPAAAGQAAYSLACLHFSAGRYVDAGALLAEAEAQLERHDPVGLLPVANAMQVGIACFTGDPPRARQLLLDVAAQLSASPVHAARLTYEAMRAGAPPRRLTEPLENLRARCDARLVAAYADHAVARAADDGDSLLAVTDEMEQIGALRYATEAAAHAADAFAREGREDSARRAAARTRDLNDRGQGSLLPAMTELDAAAVALTDREAQLVHMASDGLSNAEIADRLVLSV